ncbi:hypothetical protein E4T56_gene18145 [Termitomyces sp. T112]|nr:hypothetical protein E4T56_gene18145 [Termitomyces sp. T112]
MSSFDWERSAVDPFSEYIDNYLSDIGMSSLSTILARSITRLKALANLLWTSSSSGSDRCDADIVLMTSLCFVLEWITKLRRMGFVIISPVVFEAAWVILIFFEEDKASLNPSRLSSGRLFFHKDKFKNVRNHFDEC